MAFIINAILNIEIHFFGLLVLKCACLYRDVPGTVMFLNCPPPFGSGLCHLGGGLFRSLMGPGELPRLAFFFFGTANSFFFGTANSQTRCTAHNRDHRCRCAPSPEATGNVTVPCCRPTAMAIEWSYELLSKPPQNPQQYHVQVPNTCLRLNINNTTYEGSGFTSERTLSSPRNS